MDDNAIGRFKSGDEGPGIEVNPVAIMAWMNAIFLIILALPSMSVIVFLRRNFGCRFMKLWMILIDFIALWFLFSFTSILGARSGDVLLGITPARLFAVGMAALAVWHSRTAWQRFWAMRQDPEQTMHSMWDGDSLLAKFFPNASLRVMRCVLEPGVTAVAGILCFVLGAAVSTGFAPLGMWFLISAAFLALYESILYEFRLHAYIDLVDQNIQVTMQRKAQQLYKEGRKQISPSEVAGAPVVLDGRLFEVMEASRKMRVATDPPKS